MRTSLTLLVSITLLTVSSAVQAHKVYIESGEAMVRSADLIFVVSVTSASQTKRACSIQTLKTFVPIEAIRGAIDGLPILTQQTTDFVWSPKAKCPSVHYRRAAMTSAQKGQKAIVTVVLMKSGGPRLRVTASFDYTRLAEIRRWAALPRTRK